MKAPHEFKIMRVRECVAPAMLVDTPERAFEYWKANIPQPPWFDENKEAFVVLILNTRRGIIGHNLVSLGSLDTVTIHAREVFRPIIVAAGSAAILTRNLCASAPKLWYVERPFVWNQTSLVILFRRAEGRKESCARN